MWLAAITKYLKQFHYNATKTFLMVVSESLTENDSLTKFMKHITEHKISNGSTEQPEIYISTYMVVVIVVAAVVAMVMEILIIIMVVVLVIYCKW